MDDSFNSKLEPQLEKLKKSMLEAAKEFDHQFGSMPGAADAGATEFDSTGGNTQEAEAEAYISKLVDETFAPWFETPLVDNLKAASFEVKEVKKTFGEEVPDEKSLESGEAPDLTASAVVPMYAAQIKESIQGWTGETPEAFKKYYVRRFDFIIGLQQAVLTILELSMKAEYKAWKNAQNDVLSLVEEAAAAFDQMECWPWSSPDAKTQITVVASAISVLGALLPPLGVVAAVTSAGNSVAGSFSSSENDGDRQFDADSYTGIWEQICSALSAIQKEVESVETDLAAALEDTYNALGGKTEIGLGSEDPIEVDSMDLLKPPAPGGQVEERKEAHMEPDEKERKKKLSELDDSSTDAVGKPDDSYVPEPFDT